MRKFLKRKLTDFATAVVLEENQALHGELDEARTQIRHLQEQATADRVDYERRSDEIVRRTETEMRRLRSKVDEQRGMINELRKQVRDQSTNPKPISGKRSSAHQPTAVNLTEGTLANDFTLNGRVDWQDRTKIEWIIAGQLQTIPVPKDLADIKSWADQYVADRVILHGRALHGAKKSVFRHTHLIYAALLALGDHRDCLASGDLEARNKLNDTLAQMHMNINGSVSSTWAGRAGPDYFIHHDGKDVLMEGCLKYGSKRNPTRTMRLYFHYDKDAKKVVVGSMTAHLDNSMT